MYKIYSQVALKRPLPEHGLRTGDRGVVVHVHAKGKAYEVEFLTDEGHTIAVVTIEAEQLLRPSPEETPKYAPIDDDGTPHWSFISRAYELISPEGPSSPFKGLHPKALELLLAMLERLKPGDFGAVIRVADKTIAKEIAAAPRLVVSLTKELRDGGWLGAEERTQSGSMIRGRWLTQKTFRSLDEANGAMLGDASWRTVPHLGGTQTAT